MEKTQRITVSLPEGSVQSLDYIAARLGISRSALMAAMIAPTLPGMVQVATCVSSAPLEEADEVTRRFRGASADVIREQVKTLLSGAQDDLFSH